MEEQFVNEEEKVIRRSLNIKNLYLDPNNYRFADEVDCEKTSEADIVKERVQLRTRKYIEGEKRSNIQDLIGSFKANGYLKVDIIQLKDLGNNNYLVIEGNRRVTALKCLQEDYKNGKEIGKLDPSIFLSVPSEIYPRETDPKEHLIIMGLKHISGNKKWAAINQAQLIYDYLDEFWNDKSLYRIKEDELCSSLGITKKRLRSSQRAIHLINEYKKSDYSDQFKTDMFSLFEEAVKKTDIKEWLDWDENTYSAKNTFNCERFFSWISKAEILNENEEAEEGEFDEREPIISKVSEIRYLNEFIKNPEALNLMERSGSVISAYGKSGMDIRTTLDKAFSNIEDNIKDIVRYEKSLDENDLKKIETFEKDIRAIIPGKNLLNVSKKNVSYFWNIDVKKHFTNICIEDYKKFSKFEIENLNRINIFAGRNNSGKTTILEAVYLLCSQNDFSGFMELAQIRKRNEGIEAVYLESLLDKPIEISASFDSYPVKVKLNKYLDPDVNKGDDYMTSYSVNGIIEHQSPEMSLHTYEKSAHIMKLSHVCKCKYSSPYYYPKNDLAELYNMAIESKFNGVSAKEKILRFVKIFDSSIIDISLKNTDGNAKFIVNSTLFPDKMVDLSSYGEGLVRVFEMALCFSSCKDGVLLIDGLETGIHYSMLIKFTKFIQEMAESFNVQVFLTTHSKECVDAFIENGYANEQISAYVVDGDGEKKIKYVSGERLERLIDLIAFDLRGGEQNDN